MTDAGLPYLRDLHELEHLTLAETTIGGEGLTVLQQFPKLKYLDLGSTAIKDDCLWPLKYLQQLTQLILADCDVTDACVDHVLKLTSLTMVTVTRSRITEKGILALRSKPDLGILDLYVGEDGLERPWTPPETRTRRPTPQQRYLQLIKCPQCAGSGKCYCLRKGDGEPSHCSRCKGTGLCVVCAGSGRRSKGANEIRENV